MSWEIEFSTAAEHDLDLIFFHLADSFVALGADRSGAAEQALARVLHIRDTAGRIASAPHRVEAHGDLLPGLRHLTLGKAVYWFLVDEEMRRVRVLAIFYGGQDHQRKMLLRLLGG
ncbi:type II toxin-antitoxin system RelE/ParE family toxin [Shimia thalassica]|uniref:type II toxin-antitoxin system RelE/ParE family toxin n=1 Tax=Shimia thalassica TaxID=1715693 RepID=UPI00273705C6|nr:type II toxin-antitoxin system RelE/ParE family toxin [Shimia thalassica]MDP2520855.1 type II toxin-antitoxin system RelE/ParE family toxin [Shimia thalassica]